MLFNIHDILDRILIHIPSNEQQLFLAVVSGLLSNRGFEHDTPTDNVPQLIKDANLITQKAMNTYEVQARGMSSGKSSKS